MQPIKDFRDAIILWLISDIFLITSAGLVEATNYTSTVLDIALYVTATTMLVVSVCSFGLAVASAVVGARHVRGAAA